MSHWAKLDDNNVVIEVIKGNNNSRDEGYRWITSAFGGRWIKTSYNAAVNGYRKNFAGPGYKYDESLDAFIPPKPFESWVLNTEVCNWQPPITYPGSNPGEYVWNESTVSWEIREPEETPNE